MVALLILLAIGLAMDAFAAAVAQGAARRPNLAGAMRIAGAFGLAQGIMPLLGWGLGEAFGAIVNAIDHWLALILLGGLGVRMAWEGLRAGEDSVPQPLSGRALFATSIATSVDAAAAGVTLPVLGAPILAACATIGVTTGLLCLAGVYLGAVAGTRLGKAAEVAGGAILIGLGLTIFVDHQFLGG